jgi:hypothetical protein
MTTITVAPRNEEEYNLVMAVLHQLKIKTKEKAAKSTSEKSYGRIPGWPYTREEILEDIRLGEEEIAAGHTITHEELKKEIASWWK